MIIVAEIILRFLPVADVLHTLPMSKQDPILRFQPNKTYTYSKGWDFKNTQYRKTNDAGYLSTIDYDIAPQRPLIAIIGDSFVEALQVRAEETFYYLLQQRMERNRLFTFGKSGAPLSQYIAWLRQICQQYQPQAAIINIVGNDIDESYYPLRLRDGFFHYRESGSGSLNLQISTFFPSTLRKIANQSSLLRYLFINLRLNNSFRKLLLMFNIDVHAEEIIYAGNTSAALNTKRVEASLRVLSRFFEDITTTCVNPENILLVIDGMRPAIYDPARLEQYQNTYWGAMRQDILKRARKNNIAIIDMHKKFEENYREEQKRFEFPFDGHWNVQGHKVTAEAITNHDWFKPYRLYR